MKTKKNLIIAFISLLVVIFSTFSTAAELGTHEEIEKFIATGYSLLESVTVNTSSLVDFETAETLTVGDLTLYKCKDEFQPYDAMKQKLFSYLSPQLVITAMREYGNIFNINGDLYVYPTEGKFPAVLGAVKSLNYQTHTVNIVLAAKDSNGKEVTSEYRLVYTYDRQGGLDTGAYFDCIKGIIGDKGGERYLNEKYCVDYGTAAIRDYIISENLKEGYEKYPVKLSPEAPFMPEGIEAKYIKWDSYANVYTYAEVNESDESGKDLGARYLFTELHKDSQRIVSDTTDYDNLFALSTEYMNFIEKTVGCCGTLHDGGGPIKVGDIEYYPMVGDFSDYEKFKEYMLERFTDAFTSYILTENMNFLNIDGKTYVRGDRNQPFVEGGLKYNAVEVIEASSHYSFVVRLMCKENEEILYEHNLYFTYEEEGVRLNGLSEYEKSKYGDHYYYQVYTYADTKDYYHGIYLSYLLTENLRAGYEKYKINTVSPDSPYLSGLDIRNAQHRGAESYALVTEYDKDGKISQYHKIYVSSSSKNLKNTIEEVILSAEDYEYEKTRILIADTEAEAHDVLIHFFESYGTPSLEYGNGQFKHIGYAGVSYDDYKNQLLNIASPHLAMNVLGYYHSILNINGDKYVTGSSLLNGELSGSFQIFHEDEDCITYSNGSWGNTPVISEIVKIDGKWKVSKYREYGVSIALSVENNYDEYDFDYLFRDYIENILFGYFISENINCGYTKYPVEYDTGFDFRPMEYDIKIISFDKVSCIGSAYILIAEYDKEGNIVSHRKITVDIGEGLSETITNKVLSAEELADEIIPVVIEKADEALAYHYDPTLCFGNTVGEPTDSIKSADYYYYTIYDKPFNISFSHLTKNLSRPMAMDILSSKYSFIRKGVSTFNYYALNAPLGIKPDECEDSFTVKSVEKDRIVYTRKSKTSDKEYIFEAVFANNNWGLSYSERDSLGYSAEFSTAEEKYEIFHAYVENLFRGYLAGRNSSHLEKQNEDGTYSFIEHDIIITAFDPESGTGSAYMVLDSEPNGNSGSTLYTVSFEENTEGLVSSNNVSPYYVFAEPLDISTIKTPEQYVFDYYNAESSSETVTVSEAYTPITEEIPVVPTPPVEIEPVEPTPPAEIEPSDPTVPEKPSVPVEPAEPTEPDEPSKPDEPDEGNVGKTTPAVVHISLSSFLKYAIPIVLLLILVFIFVIVKSRDS